MEKPNVIVGKILDVDSTASGAIRPALSAPPSAPVRVHFQGGQTATVGHEHPMSTVYLEVLHELHRSGLPGYVEVDPATKVVNRVLVPIVVRVVSISEAGSGDQIVELEISHSKHIVKQSNPDFSAILLALRQALSAKTEIVVSEDDDHEIIDVRPATTSAASGKSRPALAPLALTDPTALQPVSGAQAANLFGQLVQGSCNPSTVPPPCIPFLYPDDGCWGRAHEMCRLLKAAGAQSAKIWMYGNLSAKTVNNPNCKVSWGWHVASVIVVAGANSRSVHVVDPSIFTTPVPAATWIAIQNDPAGITAYSDAAIFHRARDGRESTDDTYQDTRQVLATYRLRLKLRSADKNGPPPYQVCAALV